MRHRTHPIARQIEAALPPHVGAAVLAMDRGRVVFEHAFGLADVETGMVCTPATNFRLASVSKQFTAAAVMLLMERGMLSLDDRLRTFFPEFPEYGAQIRVKHLLTHTSGVPPYEDLVADGTTLQLHDLDVLQLLIEPHQPRFEPGTRFEYSNSGYVLLGLIVEVASRIPFHEFLMAEVFRPIGMQHSVLYQRGVNQVPHRAFGHERRGGQWVRADQSLTSATRGDGAVYTSLRDYQKWLCALDEPQLLSAESHHAVFSPHVVSDRSGSRYGFGWFLDEYRGEARIHHNGDTRGFRLCVQRFPQRRAAVFVALNCELDGDTRQMTQVGERLSDRLIFDCPR